MYTNVDVIMELIWMFLIFKVYAGLLALIIVGCLYLILERNEL